MDSDFERLVAEQYEPLRRTAFALCGHREHAEDLVQAAFVRAHRSRTRVLGADDPVAYLHRILINTSRSWRARRWHGEVAGLPDAPVEDGTDAVDLRLSVLTALRALPRDQREAVVLRHLLGLTEAESATALGCPVGTVKSRTSRGLTALRTSLPDLDHQESS